MRYLFIFICAFIVTSLSAQSYLITVAGDTVSGKFRILKDDEQGEFIRIKVGKKRDSFAPMEVKRAVNIKGAILSPIKIDGKYKFCTLEQSGYVNLYYFRMREGAETFEKQILVKLDGSTFIVPGIIRQRNLISDFLFECREVSNNILNKEIYPKTDITKIVKDFNACMKDTHQVHKTSQTKTEFNETNKKQLEDFKTLLNYSSKVKNKDAVLQDLALLMQKQLSGEVISNKEKKTFIRSLKREDNLINLFEKIITN